MDLGMQSERRHNGVLVEEGARWPQPVQLPDVRIYAECVSVSPERFVGVLLVGGEEVLRTPPTDHRERAGADARAALANRLVALLRRVDA